jgi:hypothetical protein
MTATVTRINPAYQPTIDECKECRVDLVSVHHARDFKSQCGAGSIMSIIAPLASRSDVFAEIPIGSSAVFHAVTPIEYASVRGSAYGWAKIKGRRLRTRRLCAEHIEVIRGKDPR